MRSLRRGLAASSRAFLLDGPRYDRWLLFVCPVMYAVGIAGHAIESTREAFIAMTPWFLGAMGVAMIWPVLRDGGRGAAVFVAAAWAATFGLEALGVATGLVFGPYEYGTALGAHVLRVPPVIGFNWVVVAVGCALAARAAAERVFPRLEAAEGRGARIATGAAVAIAAGALATAFDWVMEPAAIGLGYWTWFWDGIPPRNYLAWFLIGSVTAGAYAASSRPTRSVLPAAYVLIQLVFFAALRVLVVGA